MSTLHDTDGPSPRSAEIVCCGHRLGSPAQARAFVAPFLEGLGDRWKHTVAVGEKAERIAPALHLDPFSTARLINAAWAHDIGYAFPQLHPWHPVAGGRFLLQQELDSIAALVAWHSTAKHEAELLGYGEDLAWLPHEQSLVQDALDWCDMTTGPAGQQLTVTERLEEVGHRHGQASTQYRAMAMDLDRLLAIDDHITALQAARGRAETVR